MLVRNQLLFIVSASLAAPAGTAAGQAIAANQPEEVYEPGQLTFSLTGGYLYQLEADVGSARFSVQRANAGLGLTTEIADGIDLSFSLGLNFDDYEFDGVGAFASPWEDVITLSAGAIGSFQLDDKAAIFGGPIFRLAREAEVEFDDDAMMYGAVIGYKRQWLDNLRAGLGIGIISQIEDDARYYPIISLDWRFTEDWSVRSTSGLGVSTRPGLELVWGFSEGWEGALGVAYENHRFRLDEDGIAPDGIGEDTAYPIWVRVSYAAGDQLRLDAYGGAYANGELELEDEAGHHIASKDYDTAGVFGVSVNFRF
jgi:hypothetical protein